MSLLKKRALVLILLVLLVYIIIIWVISIKIRSDIFRYKPLEGSSFVSSYKSNEIIENGVKFKVYQVMTNPEKITFIYLSNNNGILNHIFNAIVSRYNIVAVEYPKESKYQNAKSLLKILQGTVSYVTDNLKIDSQQLVFFGHEIGANVGLYFSKDFKFKDIIILNQVNSEKSYCKTSFLGLFCLLSNKKFYPDSFSPNQIYSFFNDNKFSTPEDRYDIFNGINANDKFFFEIPGDSINFNFTHILDFYTNDDVIKDVKMDEKANISEDDIQETEDTLIDADGLLNDDKYVD